LKYKKYKYGRSCWWGIIYKKVIIK